MAIFVIYLAFKRDLFVVQLLDVSLVIHFDIDSFQKTLVEINFNTDAHTSLHIVLWLAAINKLPNIITNGSNRFISPTMEREIRKLDPDFDCTRDIKFRIEVWIPFV